MHENGDLHGAGRQVGGDGDVTAETDQRLGLRPAQDGSRLAHGLPQVPGQFDEVEVRFPRHGDGPDQFQFEPGLRYHPGLESLARPDAGDLNIRIQLGQGLGRRDQGGGVAGGAATGQCDAGHEFPPAASTLVMRGPAPRRRFSR